MGSYSSISVGNVVIDSMKNNLPIEDFLFCLKWLTPYLTDFRQTIFFVEVIPEISDFI